MIYQSFWSLTIITHTVCENDGFSEVNEVGMNSDEGIVDVKPEPIEISRNQQSLKPLHPAPSDNLVVISGANGSRVNQSFSSLKTG